MAPTGSALPHAVHRSALHTPAEPGGEDERRQRALLAATVTWRRRGSGLPGKSVCAGSGAEVGGREGCVGSCCGEAQWRLLGRTAERAAEAEG